MCSLRQALVGTICTLLTSAGSGSYFLNFHSCNAANKIHSIKVFHFLMICIISKEKLSYVNAFMHTLVFVMTKKDLV